MNTILCDHGKSIENKCAKCDHNVSASGSNERLVMCKCGGKPHIKKYYPHHNSRIIYCLDCEHESWIYTDEGTLNDVIKKWNSENT